FNNLQRNSSLDNLTRQCFNERYKNRMVGGSDEIPNRQFDGPALRKPGVAEHWLDSSPELMRNPDGTIQRDKDGSPLFRSGSEVKQYNASLQKDISEYVNALPEDQ